MAVIGTNSNSIIGNPDGSGPIGMGWSIGQKTPTQIAADAIRNDIKQLTAITVDEKPAPGELAVGEVAKVVTEDGKVQYFVGTYDGKLSKPLTSISSAVNAVTTQVNKAERVQTTALRTSNKIEISELRDSLEDQGLSTTDINKIIREEKAINTTESTQLKSLLDEPGLQYGVRDAATNTFVNNVVNGVTNQTTPPTSLLTYNDPVYSAPASQAIQQAKDAVAEFQLLKGITQPFLRSGNTTSGINQYAIYQALDNGSIIATKDANGVTTGYTVSEAVAAKGDDQSGFIDATGMSKASARALGLVLNNDVVIGGKANVVTDANDNHYVYDASGADRYGTQKPLFDTGRVVDSGLKDANGNPIMNKVFAEVSTDNSKRNYVSVVSNYIQQPNGTFTYGGIDSTDYTHIEGFNPIKALVIAGMSAGAGFATGPLTGLSTLVDGVQVASSLGNTVSGAVAGGLGAALSGSNVIRGGLLGALGGFTIGEVQAAAQAAGGYDNLLGQVSSGNFNSFTQAAQDAAAFANSAAGSASGVDGGGGGLVGGGESPASINFGDTSVAQGGFIDSANTANTGLTNYGTTGTTGLGPNMTYNTSASGQGIRLGLDSAGNYIDLATNMPFTGSGINFAKDAAGNFILDAAGNVLDAATNLPFQGEGVNLINFDTGAYVQPSSNAASTGNNGLLDTLRDAGSSVVDTLGVGGTILAAGAVVPEIVKAVTPGPKTDNTVYTAPLLNNVMMPTNKVPNLVQNYNNLFNRQGVGAGQYLGYDYLNNINVPPELMGLLGTSAQARPTSLTMPTPTSITPA
jgi:hypothetical protein